MTAAPRPAQITRLSPRGADDDADRDAAGRGYGGDTGESAELKQLKASLRETKPIGDIVQTVKTVDQVRAVPRL